MRKIWKTALVVYGAILLLWFMGSAVACLVTSGALGSLVASYLALMFSVAIGIFVAAALALSNGWFE